MEKKSREQPRSTSPFCAILKKKKKHTTTRLHVVIISFACSWRCFFFLFFQTGKSANSNALACRTTSQVWSSRSVKGVDLRHRPSASLQIQASDRYSRIARLRICNIHRTVAKAFIDWWVEGSPRCWKKVCSFGREVHPRRSMNMSGYIFNMSSTMTLDPT